MAAGGTTDDGEFTLEEVECIAFCGAAPCLAVNWRFFGSVTTDAFDHLVDDLAHRPAGRRGPAPRHPLPGPAQRRPHRRRRHAPPAADAAPDRGLMLTDAAPIVTARLGVPNSWTLKAYLDTGGYDGLRKALSMTPEEVSAEVMTANLLGRGGAGFEVGRKWSMLAKPRPAYLVINGDESEPCTYKDHMLLEADPHQIIEGTLICAYATGAAQAFIFVRGEFALGLERITAALNEAYAYGAVGRNIFGSGFSVDVVIHPGAGAYICGEETALLESLEGKRGYPRDKPPYFPAVKGLYMQPTIVNNVESVSNLPWIVLNSGEAFKAPGPGPLHRHPHLLPLGPRAAAGQLRDRDEQDHVPRPHLRPQAGRRHPQRQPAQGVHPRRGVGAVVRPRPARHGPRPGRGGQGRLHARVGLGHRHGPHHVHGAGRRGGSPASSTANRAASAPPAGRAAGGSTRSCTASRPAPGREADLDLLLDICDNIAPGLSWPPQKTTICVLGPSIPSSITSAIKMFRDEFLVHIKEGGCPFG